MKNNKLTEELSKLKDVKNISFPSRDQYNNSLNRNTYEHFVKLYQQRLDISPKDNEKLTVAIEELGHYLQHRFKHLNKKLKNAVDERYKELCKKYIPTSTIDNWKHDNQDPGTLLEHKILGMILDTEVDKIKSQKPEFNLTHQNITNVNKDVGSKGNNLFVARNSWAGGKIGGLKEKLDQVKNDTNTFKQSLNPYFIFKKNYIKLTQHTIDLIDNAAQDFQQELKNIYGNDYDSMNFNLYDAPPIKFSDEYSDSDLDDSSDNDSDANKNEGSNNPHSSSDHKSHEQNLSDEESKDLQQKIEMNSQGHVLPDDVLDSVNIEKPEPKTKPNKMTMKEMMTRMQEMEELLAQKDKIIDKMVSKKDVDQLMRDNERSLKEQDIKNEFIKDKFDTVLEKTLQQKDIIIDLKQDKYHLQKDKSKLNKYIDKLEFQLSKFEEVTKQKDKLEEILPTAFEEDIKSIDNDWSLLSKHLGTSESKVEIKKDIDESYIESSLSVINLEQNNLDLDISGNAHSIEETDV